MMPSQPRAYYIDWIRVLAFLLLIFFHSAMPFVNFGWEVKNADRSDALSSLIIWLHQWRLPLLFFISGVGVSFSLRSRTVLAFFGERVVRLFVPLLFAMFFTIPAQVYIEWLQEGKISMSYWEFYPTVWDLVPYPEGTLTWSHMWFVVYLFVFTILLLPLFAFFRLRFISQAKQYIQQAFNNPLVLLVLFLPFMGYYFGLYVRWPEQGSLLDDWFVFMSSITFYFYGYFFGDIPNFWEACERHRKVFLTIAAGCALLLVLKYYVPVALPKQQNADLYWYGFLDALQIWTIILSAVGFARHYLNFTNPALTYLTSAVYPFYILHQTLIVVFGFFVVQWPLPIGVKLLVLVLGCFASLFLLYHYLIRPYQVTRILFGLKRRQPSNIRELK